ncbi:hypothetical protein V2G26_019393 [Clonostachys chloroleuca]
MGFRMRKCGVRERVVTTTNTGCCILAHAWVLFRCPNQNDHLVLSELMAIMKKPCVPRKQTRLPSERSERSGPK